MKESGVKTEGGEVIPPPPDSFGKKKRVIFFLQIFIQPFGI